MKTKTRKHVYFEVDGVECEIPNEPSGSMSYLDTLVHKTADRIIIGYLVDDRCPSNPLEEQDGYGSIFSGSRRMNQVSEFCAALGYDRYGEKDFSAVDGKITVEMYRDKINEMYGLDDLVEQFEVEYERNEGESDEDFVYRCAELDWNDDRYTIDTAYDDLRESLWEKGREDGTVGTKYATLLDVYQHSGISYNVSGKGMQCQWDTARGGAVWVPDNTCIAEIEHRAPVYRKGEINKLRTKWVCPLGTFDKWHEAFEALKADTTLPLESEQVGVERACRELAQQACEIYTAYCNGDTYGRIIAQCDLEGNPIEDDETAVYGYYGSEDAYACLKEDFDHVVKHQ